MVDEQKKLNAFLIYSLCDFGIDVANPQAVSIMRRALCNDGGIFHRLCCRRHVYPVETRLKESCQKHLQFTYALYTWRCLGFLFW